MLNHCQRVTSRTRRRNCLQFIHRDHRSRRIISRAPFKELESVFQWIKNNYRLAKDPKVQDIAFSKPFSKRACGLCIPPTSPYCLVHSAYLHHTFGVAISFIFPDIRLFDGGPGGYGSLLEDLSAHKHTGRINNVNIARESSDNMESEGRLSCSCEVICERTSW